MHRMKMMIVIMALLLPVRAFAGDAVKTATLYKNALCTCCEDHAAYLRHNGYEVKVIPTHELPQLRAKHGVSEELTGCHMTLIDGYVFEGHVTVSMIDKVLGERPDIKGISLPGMPLGVPGMPGPKIEPFTVFAIPAKAAGGEPSIYMVE